MKVVVIGGGPAGMIAAMTSAQSGNDVTIIEKMEMLGKKLLITGKGRCNITSSLPIDEFIKNIPGNGMFMYSSFNNFTNEDIIKLLKQEGVETKVERGNRVFPVSDRSQDVQKAFLRTLKKLNVKIITNARVKKILVNDFADNIIEERQEGKNCEKINIENEIKQSHNLEYENKKEFANKNSEEKRICGVIANINGKDTKIVADKVILATGGMSYPGTGSTGDGYKLAKELGHTVTKIRASLVPLTVHSGRDLKICKSMQGLSLKNINIKIKDTSKSKVIYEDFGEMLFTHFGVSGPTILSGSAHLLRYKNVDELLKDRKIVLSIDLKPALSEEKLDDRILRDFNEEKNKYFKNSLDKLLPKKMIDVIIELSEISPNKKVNEITKKERLGLVQLLKNLEISISGFRPIEEAIVTSGGISIKEINPKTMESKIVNGLYFAGEIIDVDAYTGGFNLQIAYSTGYTAGK